LAHIIQEGLAVLPVINDLAFLDTADHNVLQGSRSV
jgi:hypothetical protein